MFQFSPVSDRIQKIRSKRDVFTGGKLMSINSERTKLYTDYYKAHENEFPILKRAGALKNWCEMREINVFDDDIFIGTPGPEERTLSPYVDWSCNWLPNLFTGDTETFKRAWQSGKGVYMSDEQREVFREAYDYWKDRSLSRMVEGALTDDVWDAFGNGCILNSMGNADQRFKTVSGMPQGHYIAGFGKVVNIGFGAVRADAMERIKKQSGRVFGKMADSHMFYYSVVRVCDGAITLAKRFAKACRDKAEVVSDKTRRAELQKMADSLEWIMEKPVRTYWEGLQAILLYQLMLSTDAQQHGTSMGRVDKYVGHLLDRDLETGELTLDQAQEYTDAFILRISDVIVLPFLGFNNEQIIELNERGENVYSAIYNGLTATAGIALTIGGQKPDGTDDSNAVTRLLLQSYGRMKLPDPTVALRINVNTPEDIWRVGIESSKLCGGIPQFNNDDVIIPALRSIGFTEEDAYNYSIVGCVEPAGTGNEWPACGMTGRESIWNMMDVIQLVVNGGVNPRTGVTALPCKKLYEYESFDELLETFKLQMQYVLDWNVTYANIFERMYSHYFPCISASVMLDGCLEKGLDATAGGCKYNRTGITACGTANIGDSLMAIKKLIFDDKTVDARRFYDALQANWVGYENLRETIINDVPHYGNDIDEVDALCAWGLGLFADIMANAEGPRGKYSGGTFTMTAHIYMGKMLGATPDGRLAESPIADAISPQQGYDKNGPTAYLRSAAKLPHVKLTNGDQLNIKFTPTAVEGDQGAEKLSMLIQSYFALGGMQVQFNVVSTEQLHAAQADPEQFKNLIVRIAGFSTYFVTLARDTQDDFIRRSEQAI
ncbi:MAG: hypothetical protein LBC78_02445 [Oscillospiraceae bacterium]|jgi:formate C-acetyltransferase|nr:hypothetical protein [Oscillospiraceae bacterium]